jgi:hypothetical protein
VGEPSSPDNRSDDGPGHRSSLDAAPLDQIEAAVARALTSGLDDQLRVLGYGEISLVIGWPADEPTWACKRLPAFATTTAFDQYRALFERYLDVLRERGVDPVPSLLRRAPTVASAASGSVVAYVVQAVLPTATLGPEVLRAATPHEGERFLSAIFDHVVAVTDARTGFDAQISNWAQRSGGWSYLDVTTPMLFDADGRFDLDLDLFMAAYPWALRWPIRRFVAPGVVGAYREARHVLVDLAANLVKERLETWIPIAVALTNDRVSPPVTSEEVRRYYRSDARLWEVMLRLRRADRWWQHRVRRRPYPFLLPGPIDR